MSKNIQLVDVQPIANEIVQLSFKNVSGKAILQIRVAAPSKATTGLDAFSTGSGVIEPGATFPIRFESKDFSNQGKNSKSLRVQAIVYTDGSCIGSTKILDNIENEMLGAALETQRDADILAANPDSSVAGFDTSLPHIGRSEPPTNIEAIKSVSGLALRGVPQDYIDVRLDPRNSYLAHGINISRETLLTEIGWKQSEASLSEAQPQRKDGAVIRAKTNGLSDMTSELRSLLDTQIKYIAALIKFRYGGVK